MSATAARVAERKAARPKGKPGEGDFGPAECAICGAFFTKHRVNQRYCSAACRESRVNWSYAKELTATERGYGKAHRLERAKWKPIVESGQATCCLCGYPIDPDGEWHLDHTEDRTGYRGAAHPDCNRRDGARRGNRAMPRPQLDKTCEGCRREFVTVYPRQRYCSRECKPKREGEPAVCKVTYVECRSCGGLFTSRHGALYCADHRGYQTAAPTLVQCVVCGTQTTSLNGMTKKYCSRACSHATARFRAQKSRARRRYKQRKRAGLGQISAA